jgi:hypothetical protein
MARCREVGVAKPRPGCYRHIFTVGIGGQVNREKKAGSARAILLFQDERQDMVI